jgi:pyridoxal phosphate enzyme (YggS family)
VSSIAENIGKLHSSIPTGVQLIAVSKTKTVATIREAMAAGQRAFGENKALEMKNKHEQLPDAEWHFIGHLQTNKVKYIAPFVRMIHSVDSLKLLEEIDIQAEKYNRTIDCLMQIHVAQEEQKFGLTEAEADHLLEMMREYGLQHVRMCGLMGIATNTDDPTVIRNEFRRLANFFHHIKQRFFPADEAFRELSMGMSHDYRIAIEEGSTMLRIGSIIFGERQY